VRKRIDDSLACCCSISLSVPRCPNSSLLHARSLLSCNLALPFSAPSYLPISHFLFVRVSPYATHTHSQIHDALHDLRVRRNISGRWQHPGIDYSDNPIPYAPGLGARLDFRTVLYHTGISRGLSGLYIAFVCGYISGLESPFSPQSVDPELNRHRPARVALLL
jgi:hypothetical protein